jgi:hypothetical protein
MNKSKLNIIYESLGRQLIAANIIVFGFLICIEICGILSNKQITFPFLSILSNVSYGFIASTVFYVIMIALPQEIQRSHLSRFLNNKISFIKKRFDLLFISLNQSSKYPRSIDHNNINIPNEEEMKEILMGVSNSNIESPYHKVNGDWLGYFEMIRQKTREDIFSMFQFSDILDKEIIGKLSEIDDIINNQLFLEFNHATQNLEFFAHPIREAMILSHDISNIYRNKYSHYLKEHSKRYSKRNKKS